MPYEVIATTIILLPSVTKTFAMSTVFYSTVASIALAKKGIARKKAERHRKRVSKSARALNVRGAQMND